MICSVFHGVREFNHSFGYGCLCDDCSCFSRYQRCLTFFRTCKIEMSGTIMVRNNVFMLYLIIL